MTPRPGECPYCFLAPLLPEEVRLLSGMLNLFLPEECKCPTPQVRRPISDCCYVPGLAIAQNIGLAERHWSAARERLAPVVAKLIEGRTLSELFVPMPYTVNCGSPMIRLVRFFRGLEDRVIASREGRELLLVSASTPLGDEEICYRERLGHEYKPEVQRSGRQYVVETFQPNVLKGRGEEVILGAYDESGTDDPMLPNRGCIFLDRDAETLEPKGDCLLHCGGGAGARLNPKPIGCTLQTCQLVHLMLALVGNGQAAARAYEEAVYNTVLGLYCEVALASDSGWITLEGCQPRDASLPWVASRPDERHQRKQGPDSSDGWITIPI